MGQPSGSAAFAASASLHAGDKRVPSFSEAVDSRIRSVPEQIASAVYAAILDGSLQPGTRLPSEEEIADVFCVSKPTVREALKRLKTTNVIRASRGRTGGMYVTGIGPRSLTAGSRDHIHLALGNQQLTNEQLREVRYELELLSAASAAVRRTDEDLRSLLENEQRRPGADQVPVSLEAALQYDLTFHRLLARSSHNPVVSSFVSATILAYRSFDLGQEPRSPAQIIAHLDEVLVEVQAGNAEAARRAMERHLQVTGGPCRQCPLPCSPQAAANCRI